MALWKLQTAGLQNTDNHVSDNAIKKCSNKDAGPLRQKPSEIHRKITPHAQPEVRANPRIYRIIQKLVDSCNVQMAAEGLTTIESRRDEYRP
jgi:hypothetical protein